MDRRAFLGSGLAAAGLEVLADGDHAQDQEGDHITIIDGHCHAGHGKNFTKQDPGSEQFAAQLLKTPTGLRYLPIPHLCLVG